MNNYFLSPLLDLYIMYYYYMLTRFFPLNNVIEKQQDLKCITVN